MNSFEITLPGYYIAKGKGGKEQIVKYHQEYYGKENNLGYLGYYGLNGYHEVFTKKNNIRELTSEENEAFSKKQYWTLPQQFYHSDSISHN